MTRRRALMSMADKKWWVPYSLKAIFEKVVPNEIPTFNLWDEEWIENYNCVETKNPIPVIPDSKLYLYCSDIHSYANVFLEYDANMNQLSQRAQSLGILTVSSNTRYVKFRMNPGYGTTYNHDICISLSSVMNGIYAPYQPKTVLDRGRILALYGAGEVKNQLFTKTELYAAAGSASYANLRGSIDLVSGHKYFLCATQDISLTTDARNIPLFVVPGTSTLEVFNPILTRTNGNLSVSATENQNLDSGLKYGFFNCTADAKKDIVWWVQGAKVDGTAVDVRIEGIQFIDLTKEFPFNTPTSIDDPRIQNLIKQAPRPFDSGSLESAVVGEVAYQRLPDDYQEVEYIEGTGTQYIKTDYIPTSSTSLSLQFMATSTSTSYNWSQITGEKTSYHSSSSLQLAFCTGGNYPNILGLDYGEATDSIAVAIDRNVKAEVKMTPDNWIINNTTVVPHTYSLSGVGLPLWIFDCNNNNRGEFPFTGRLYSYKIYENTELVHTFMPCYRKSDNTIGLYDTIEGKFYTNAGTGVFLKGDDVEYRQRYLPDAYQEVEYLESHGTEWIDTGFNPNQDTRIVADFKVSAFTATGPFFFGSGASYNDHAFEFYYYQNRLQSNYNYTNSQSSVINSIQKIYIDKNKNNCQIFADNDVVNLNAPYGQNLQDI